MIKVEFANNKQAIIQENVQHCQLISQIGKGANGALMLGRHMIRQEMVAIKIIKMRSQKQKERMENNFAVLKKLNHEGIAKVYEFFADQGYIFIVMEYCKGGDLLSLFKNGNHPEIKTAERIFKQVLDAVCYLHDNGIAHRDLKLENIVLDGNGNPKIIDFDSMSTNGTQKSKEIVGTLQYLCPEALINNEYNPFKADIWALGIIFATLINGQLPYRIPKDNNDMRKIIKKGQLLWPKCMRYDMKKFVLSMLSLNPEMRIDANGLRQKYEEMTSKWYHRLAQKILGK